MADNDLKRLLEQARREELIREAQAAEKAATPAPSVKPFLNVPNAEAGLHVNQYTPEEARSLYAPPAVPRTPEGEALDREMSYYPVGSGKETDLTRRLYNDRWAQDAMNYGIPTVFGFEDEAASVVTGRPVEEYRADKARVAERSPGALGAGQLIGNLLIGGPAMYGAGMASAGSGLGIQALAMGGTAAGVEAARQFAEGEGGAGPRMANVAENWRPIAAAGAIGAAAPVAGRIAGALLDPGPSNANLRAMNVGRRASREIARRFADDNEIRDVRQYLTELGPDATLADAGPSMRGLASKGATTMEGPQRPAIYRSLVNRGEGAPARINDALDNTLGVRRDMTALREGMDAARNRWANPAYRDFGQRRYPLTPQLRDALRRAARTGAIAEAREIARAEGFDLNAAMFDNPANVEIEGRALDYISRGLRDRAASRAAGAKTGSAAAMRSLNDEILDHVPDLRDIRRRFATDMEMREATELGGGIFSRAESVDDFRVAWRDMSEPERAAFRLSARDAIEQKMATARNEATAGIAALGPRATREKLRIAFGDEAVEELTRVINAEDVFRNTRNTIVRDTELSPRYPGQANPWQDPDVNADGLPRGMLAEAKGIAGRGYQAAKRSFALERPDEVNREMARVLTTSGPERDRIVQALIRDQLAAQNRTARGVNADRLVRALLSGAAVTAPSLQN